ncbi:MAG: hypothetical protein Pars2KO_02370 [Parasphingorhabdus sp.]
MEPIEIIGCLQKALIRLDGANEPLAAMKVAEAIELLKIELDCDLVLKKALQHDND